jgi:hypothetical protein
VFELDRDARSFRDDPATDGQRPPTEGLARGTTSVFGRAAVVRQPRTVTHVGACARAQEYQTARLEAETFIEYLDAVATTARG